MSLCYFLLMNLLSYLFNRHIIRPIISNHGLDSPSATSYSNSVLQLTNYIYNVTHILLSTIMDIKSMLHNISITSIT